MKQDKAITTSKDVVPIMTTSNLDALKERRRLELKGELTPEAEASLGESTQVEQVGIDPHAAPLLPSIPLKTVDETGSEEDEGEPEGDGPRVPTVKEIKSMAKQPLLVFARSHFEWPSGENPEELTVNELRELLLTLHEKS